MPGKSSKFFLDYNMNGKQMPAGKEIIKYEQGKFLITDINGIQYEYSLQDQIETVSGGQSISGKYPTSSITTISNNYYLTKIVSIGEVVEFIYDTVEYSYDNPNTYFKGSIAETFIPSSYSREFEVRNLSIVDKYTLPLLKTIKVNSINRIEFSYGSVPRKDVNNKYTKKKLYQISKKNN